MTHNPITCRQHGLTLLETLVALAIFAVLGVIAYSGLDSVLRTRETLTLEAKRLSRLQLALHFIERDIEQTVARSIRDDFGQMQPALLGDDYRGELSLTRAGWDNLLARPRASLQRLRYRLDTTNTRLLRDSWPILDRGSALVAQQTVLLDGVEQLRLRFLNTDDQWLDRWPPVSAEGEQRFNLLPRAVEIRLILADWGEIVRLLRLVGQVHDTV